MFDNETYNNEDNLNTQEEEALDTSNEFIIRYGREEVKVNLDEVRDKTIAEIFTQYSEDLMLSRSISSLNIRHTETFVSHDTKPVAGAVYSALAVADSKAVV